MLSSELYQSHPCYRAELASVPTLSHANLRSRAGIQGATFVGPLCLPFSKLTGGPVVAVVPIKTTLHLKCASMMDDEQSAHCQLDSSATIESF